MNKYNKGELMEDYQKQIIKEKKDLDIKIDKLSYFLNHTTSLSQAETSRINRQATYMDLYSDVLAERIENFT